MDVPIRGVEAQRGVSGVGANKRQARQNQEPFDLDAETSEEGSSGEAEQGSTRPDEDLPTAGASDDEAGGRLDVTA